MLWNRFEWGCWTVGLEVEHIYTAHIGPLKLSWVPRGTPFYNDMKRIGTRR